MKDINNMAQLQCTKMVVILSLLFFSQALGKKRNRCEKIRIPFCKDVGYNTTIFPNNLKHDTQDEAMIRSIEFNPLVEAKCSPDIGLFLCSLYVPVCTEMRAALPPCRKLCESARDGCENLMNKFGYQWPESFQCQNFPKQGLCIGRNSSSTSEQTKKLKSRKHSNIQVHLQFLTESISFQWM